MTAGNIEWPWYAPLEPNSSSLFAISVSFIDLSREHIGLDGRQRLTDQATHFCPVLIDLRILVCHLTQLGLFPHDVQHVRIDLNFIESERVDLSDLVESPLGRLKVLGRYYIS